MVQELAGADALVAAAIVGLLSVANARGRLLWTGVSDAVGRRGVFVAMFLLQTPALLILPGTRTPVGLGVLGMLVLLCYGGGFGTMAAFAADYFGLRQVGMIFGLLMTACGAGGVAGPLLIAVVRERSGGYGPALVVLAAGSLLGAAVTFALRPPVSPTRRTTARLTQALES